MDLWSEYTPNRDFSRSKNNKYIIYVLRFEIDSLTADIRLRNCSIPGTGNCLDYEAVRQYNLTLIAAGMLNMVLYHSLSGLFFYCFHIKLSYFRPMIGKIYVQSFFKQLRRCNGQTYYVLKDARCHYFVVVCTTSMCRQLLTGNYFPLTETYTGHFIPS